MIVSVIIPCRNEEQNIAACVNAVFASKLPAGCSLEVFVVDGQSSDKTQEIIQKLQQKHPALQYISNPKRITPVAFNLGINASKGEYIQVVGARQIIADDYILRGVERLQNQPEIWCVGGKVENVFENELGEIIARAMDTPFGVGGGNFRILKESTYVDTIGTPLFRRSVFEKVGLFDEDLVRNQDDELSFRIIKAGGKIFLDIEMKVNYFVRGNFKNLFRQYFQYGYWKVYVNKKHRTITTLRQLAPAALMLFISIVLPVALISLIGYVRSDFNKTIYVLPMIIYCFVTVPYVFIAGITAFQKAGKTVQASDYFRTFLILHSSYGLGYLQGILHFLILRKNPSKKHTDLSR